MYSSDISWDGRFTMDEWWRKYTSSQQVLHKPSLFSKFVGRGSLVFDIGANRGGMTYAFRQLGAHVIAVEPLHLIAPKRVKEFAWKFANDPHVILLACAVAPTATVELAMPNLPNHWIVTSASREWQAKSAHAHLYKNKIKPIRKTVPAVTLDNLIERYGEPDFIKIDVEGYGAEVIGTLTRAVKALNMEFHKDWLWSNRDAMEHLNTLADYEYNYVLGNGGKLALENWIPNDAILRYLSTHLTERGKGSWGDIYARRLD